MPLAYDPAMRRISWLLVVLLLLKLSLGTAAAMQLGGLSGRSTESGLPPCHTGMAQAAPFQEHPNHDADRAPTAGAVGHSTMPSQEVLCNDCQLCCAFGLNVFNLSLLQAAPTMPTRALTQRWSSVSLRPELRPPLL
jgi:hypothetical protein